MSVGMDEVKLTEGRGRKVVDANGPDPATTNRNVMAEGSAQAAR